MATYELKLKPTDEDVDAFLAGIEDERKRADSIRLREIMEEVSGQPAELWTYGTVGFGRFRYRYESGHGGEVYAVGFAPRKANITLYLGGFEGHEETLERLGKHKLGKGCLYIKRLSDVDESALRELIASTVDSAAQTNVEA